MVGSRRQRQKKARKVLPVSAVFLLVVDGGGFVGIKNIYYDPHLTSLVKGKNAQVPHESFEQLLQNTNVIQFTQFLA